MVKMKSMLAALVPALALSAATLVAAPALDHHEGEEEDIQQLIEIMRKDVRGEKADIVAKTMVLNSEEAALFWPIYKRYEAELKVLGDERLAIITDYADNVDTLTDEKAEGLITRAVALEGKEHALKERYLKEFLAVLPAKVVARFYQVESRINTLIDLELSGQIPLVH